MPTRRTVLSGVAGITLGSTLPAGANAAEGATTAAAAAAYDDVAESVWLTPRPAEADGASHYEVDFVAGQPRNSAGTGCTSTRTG